MTHWSLSASCCVTRTAGHYVMLKVLRHIKRQKCYVMFKVLRHAKSVTSC